MAFTAETMDTEDGAPRVPLSSDIPRAILGVAVMVAFVFAVASLADGLFQ